MLFHLVMLSKFEAMVMNVNGDSLLFLFPSLHRRPYVVIDSKIHILKIEIQTRSNFKK